MRYALAVLSIASMLLAQDAQPRPAREILRDFERVSMPSFSSGNDPESLRRFESAIREGSLRKAELALELFAAYPDHARLPRLMDTRWATFNNVTNDFPKVIVETSLLLENEDVRPDLARVALAARTRAVVWSPQSDNRERLVAVRELIAADPDNEITGIALMDVAVHHLADPKAMRRLFEIAVRHWPDSAYVGRPARRWLKMLEKVGQPFAAVLPAELRERFTAEVAARAPFTVVQLWSGWVVTDGSRREIAAARAMRTEFGDGVRLLGLLVGDPEERLPAARKAGVDWPQIGVADDGPGRAFLGASRLPCYFVLDAELEIVGIVGSAAAAALRVRGLRE